MDILASILAYLGCMAGIVGALVISFALFFSAPHIAQPNIPQRVAHNARGQSVATTAKAVTPNAATAAVAKAPTKSDRDTQAVSAIAQNAAPAPTPIPPPTASARAKMAAARAQKLRRFVQEERARRWAYQQDPDFESRFLGYVD
jgi:hypothetical protein